MSRVGALAHTARDGQWNTDSYWWKVAHRSLVLFTQKNCISADLPVVVTLSTEVGQQKALARTLAFGLLNTVTIQTHSIHLKQQNTYKSN